MNYYMIRSFDHAGYYETRLILMIVGIVGVALSLLFMLAWSPRRRIVERDPYREPPTY